MSEERLGEALKDHRRRFPRPRRIRRRGSAAGRDSDPETSESVVSYGEQNAVVIGYAVLQPTTRPLDSSRMAGPGHHNGWRGAARDRDNAIQMNRRIGTLAALIFALTAFGGLPSGSAARTPTITHTLHVDITEWAVVPSQGLVSAGPLRVTVEDYGRLRHELDIIRTPAWGQELRTRNGRAVGENAAPPVVVAPGQTRSTNIYLAPGFYVLLDNIPGHYAVGGAVSIIVA